MISQHEWFSDTGQLYVDLDVAVLRRTTQYLGFQMQMTQSLQARSRATEERLRNEIALVGFKIRSIDHS